METTKHEANAPCECDAWCRANPQPRTDRHHATCPRHKLYMVEIERGGVRCVFETLEAAIEEATLHRTDGEDGDTFTWTNCDMTRAEFGALPEFEGW